nr:hypothetical protein Iba_chr14eCG6040 [Ipomoea batatas]
MVGFLEKMMSREAELVDQIQLQVGEINPFLEPEVFVLYRVLLLACMKGSVRPQSSVLQPFEVKEKPGYLTPPSTSHF